MSDCQAIENNCPYNKYECIKYMNKGINLVYNYNVIAI